MQRTSPQQLYILAAQSQYFSRLERASIVVANSTTASKGLQTPYVIIRSRDCGRHLHTVSAHNGVISSTAAALGSKGTAAPTVHHLPRRQPAAVRVHKLTSSKGRSCLMNAMSWSGFGQANLSAETAAEFWLQSCEEGAPAIAAVTKQGQLPARSTGTRCKNEIGAQIIHLATSL